MFAVATGVLSAVTQVVSVFGLFDKAAAVAGKALGGKSAKVERVNSGAKSSTTLIAGRGLFLGGIVGPIWYALGQILPNIHDAAATGAFSAMDLVLIGSGFLMAVQRYKTENPVSR